MTSVPQKIWDRWRTGILVADAKHVLIVRIRPGRFVRSYDLQHHIDHATERVQPAHIVDGDNATPWQATWTPLGPWVALPGVQSMKHTRSFDQKGSSSGTIVMDNIAFPEVEGAAGLYHTIERGYYAPSKRTSNRIEWWPETGQENVLNGGMQVEVWEGYGAGPEVEPLDEPDSDTNSCAPTDAAITRTWTGLIEQLDLESNPDHITITARDFGLAFTDQRLQGDNKARELRCPITFGDREQTMGTVSERATSTDMTAITVVDGRHVGTTEIAAGPDVPVFDPSGTTGRLVNLKSPGVYEKFISSLNFTITPRATTIKNVKMWLSVYVGAEGGVMDGDQPLAGAQWVAMDGVPDSPDTTPAVRYWDAIGPTQHWLSLAQLPAVQAGVYEFDYQVWLMGHSFQLPKGSKFRITYSWDQTGATPTSYFTYAAVFSLMDDAAANAAGVNAEHWVLVEDAADVVTTCCVWAGFKEWEIEPFGWSLFHPVQFGEDKYLQDVIDYVAQNGNVVWYMGPPTDDDRSIGVPHFEPQAATVTPSLMVEVRDENLLETAELKWDLSNLPSVIRFRGDPVQNDPPQRFPLAMAGAGVHFGIHFGATTGDGSTGSSGDGSGATSGGAGTWEQSLLNSYMATYFPPWTGDSYVMLGDTSDEHPVGENPDRLGGIVRHFLQAAGINTPIGGLGSNAECLFACLLSAIQYALGECTGQVQTPGLPGIGLNQQISVVDRGSGINSRLWVASIESTHTLGPQGKWVMVVAGSYVDHADMEQIAADYDYALMQVPRPASGDETSVTKWTPPPPRWVLG